MCRMTTMQLHPSYKSSGYQSSGYQASAWNLQAFDIEPKTAIAHPIMSVEDLDTNTSGEDFEIPIAQKYTINLTMSQATRCEYFACIQVPSYRTSCAFRLRRPRHTPTEMYLAEWFDIYPNMVGESCLATIIDPETGQIGATCCSSLSTGDRELVYISNAAGGSLKENAMDVSGMVVH